ncbi:MAG: N-6 DNA methylase [Chitinophagaceae bacterium]
MNYKIAETKEECLTQLTALVTSFRQRRNQLKADTYKETPLRVDYINPFLKSLGWDVDNIAAKDQFQRDVEQEETIDVTVAGTVTRKNPDYTLNIQGSKKLFIEAKKVSVDIEKSKSAAFQTRRYGWNAHLGISILTNFDKLIIYDCRYIPVATDEASVARYKVFDFEDFITEFDSLYELLAFPSVSSGSVETFFSLHQHNLTTFDDYFLKQIEQWRVRLATNIVQQNNGFNDDDINFLVQRLLNRIVFLRICEDRDIEKYELLKNIKNYDGLKLVFQQSDKTYNSGLFDFIEDNFSMNIILQSTVLVEIFKELYYPDSPYDFSVVDPAILSQIYERYLGSKITIGAQNKIEIIEEPEVAASDGVVPTPKLIVSNIVKETLAGLLENKTVQQIENIKIGDICCGSGTFLISVYDYLLEKITLAYITAGVFDDEVIIKDNTGTYRLTLKAKHAFLLSNIYGVDINPYAIEVAKFSLLLKLLEGENEASIKSFLKKYHQKALPSLNDNIKNGNSLVDEKYFIFDKKAIRKDALLNKVKPFDWNKEFPLLQQKKGFDAIVGNPPYVRIQNMVKFQSEEIEYYQSTTAGYTVASKETFDKYYLFIQRAIQLLNPDGRLGYIVPNKFFILQGGEGLRRYITTNSSLHRIIHFGVTQVFPGRSTYTAMLILHKKKPSTFTFGRIAALPLGPLSDSIQYDTFNNADFSDKPWVFTTKKLREIFEKMRKAKTKPLDSLVDISVGLQTSRDRVFIFQPFDETATTYKVKVAKKTYEIEKAVCKPCILDLPVHLFDTIAPNAQMIFPYTVSKGEASVIEENDLKTNFPLAYKYLKKFKTALSARSINGSDNPKWYQFGRSQSLTKFHDTPKLIWKVLSTQPAYVYDQQNIQFTGGGNGPFYAIISPNYAPQYIMGILCHPLIEAMVKAGASEFRGAYYSHGKQFIKDLPIPEIDLKKAKEKKLYSDIITTVDDLIAAKAILSSVYKQSDKIVQERKMQILQNTLISDVNKLYGISEEEVKNALQDDLPLTA